MSSQKIVLLFFIVFSINFYSNAQAPKPKKFIESSLSVAADTNKLFGTLTMPLAKKTCPVVLLISGSGHTDRDGNQPNAKTNAYKQLAEKLAEKGIATLRYDKRGVGESVFNMNEGDLRFDMYIDDATSWIHLLNNDKRFSKVVVAGHSEGSLIGMVACQRAPCTGYISIAGGSTSIDQILKVQLMTAIPDTAYYNKACAYLDTLKEGKLLTNSDPALAALFRPSIQPYMINWMKYNPAQEIAKLKMHVMIAQGDNDIQVIIGNAFELSDASPNSLLKIIKGMNHVLKHSEIDREKNMATYSDPTLPVAPELIKEIVNFITLWLIN